MKILVIVMVMLLISFSSNCQAAEIVVSDALVSDFITKSGSKIGKGPVNQSLVSLSSDGFYFSVWNNYDFSEKRTTETDLVVGKKISLGKVSIDLNFQRRIEEGDDQNLLELGLKWKGAANCSMLWSRLVTDGLGSGKDLFYFEIGKPFFIGSLVLTPSVSSAYLYNYYATTGWAHVTARVRADYALSKNISVFAQASYQDGLMSKKLDFPYASGGVRVLF